MYFRTSIEIKCDIYLVVCSSIYHDHTSQSCYVTHLLFSHFTVLLSPSFHVDCRRNFFCAGGHT
jgi:hypothetical protein